MWVILYLSRERQHFKNTLVYIRRNKAKNYDFFGGGKSFFRNILLIFLIDFWLSLLKFSECNLIFFLYDFWIFLVFYYSFFFLRVKKMDFFFFFTKSVCVGAKCDHFKLEVRTLVCAHLNLDM